MNKNVPIIQVALQVWFGGPIEGFTFRAWDIINYLTAVFFLMAVDRIYKKERYE